LNGRCDSFVLFGERHSRPSRVDAEEEDEEENKERCGEKIYINKKCCSNFIPKNENKNNLNT
jgi:hypothetical protein